MPVPPAWKTVRKFQGKICDAFGLTQATDGLSANVNPITKLEHDIASAVRNNWLDEREGNVYGEGCDPLVIVHSFDSANCYGDVSVSAQTVKIANLKSGTTNLEAPVHTGTWLLWRGGDSNESYRKALGGEAKKTMTELLSTSRIQVKRMTDRDHGCALPGTTPIKVWDVKGLGVNAPSQAGANEAAANEAGANEDLDMLYADLEHYACADQSAMYSGFGMGKCNHVYGCGYCKAEVSEFCSFDKEVISGHQKKLRTLKETMLLSHLAVGICPGCNVQIMESKKAIEEEQARCKRAHLKPRKMCVVAQVGDTDNPATVGGKAWLLAHFNVRYANPVLMAIEPKNWAVCVLHLHLRLVSALLSYTVFHRLTEYDKKWWKKHKADDRDDSDSICHKLFECCEFVGFEYAKSVLQKSRLVPNSTRVSQSILSWGKRQMQCW